MVTSGLKPERVFYYFEKISSIPRGSGNEKAVSDYCVSVARELGLYCYQDEVNNVLIRKPASNGCEKAEGVIIQGHLDMVCEKNKDVIHDFINDPIKLIVDNNYLIADGTTLGGDDGIAIAMGLALIEDNDIKHPQIELLFTTDEEVGMKGSKNFGSGLLSGTRLINLDSEDEGIFIVSCCGGAKAKVSVPVVTESAPVDFIPVAIRIRGLFGGHSGGDIHLQRANANKLMGRILRQLGKTFFFRLKSINGGLMDNAITRECDAIIYIPAEDIIELTDLCNQFENMFSNEYASSEKSIKVFVERVEDKQEEVLDFETTNKIIYVLNLIPYGVMQISLEIEGLVETSNNLGIVRTLDSSVDFICAVRSSVATRKYDVLEGLQMITELVGGTMTLKGEYPGWEYKKESKLREICVQAYKEMFGNEPKVQAIHAGLECGLLGFKYPELDMISMGPEMHGIHTPCEKMSIPSVERMWSFITFVIEKLSE
ncbi:MAG: aminoacyl-histidine dipeptidase [Candidatus Metalachnospira sp.]|nr:aminoacyl-histidine dipeptidase [Candidatus Metalachnospira sp.]